MHIILLKLANFPPCPRNSRPGVDSDLLKLQKNNRKFSECIGWRQSVECQPCIVHKSDFRQSRLETTKYLLILETICVLFLARKVVARENEIERNEKYLKSQKMANENDVLHRLESCSECLLLGDDDVGVVVWVFKYERRLRLGTR